MTKRTKDAKRKKIALAHELKIRGGAHTFDNHHHRIRPTKFVCEKSLLTCAYQAGIAAASLSEAEGGYG